MKGILKTKEIEKVPVDNQIQDHEKSSGGKESLKEVKFNLRREEKVVSVRPKELNVNAAEFLNCLNYNLKRYLQCHWLLMEILLLLGWWILEQM